MDTQQLKQVLKETIVSNKGVLAFDFLFDTNNAGKANVYDRQLEVRFVFALEFDSFEQVIILIIKLNDPMNRIRKMTTHLSKLRNELVEMESAYDVV